MSRFKRRLLNYSWELMLVGFLAIAVIFASNVSPYYLSFDQITYSLANSIVTQGILALAFMLLIAIGEMDLSLPAILAIGTVTLGKLAAVGVPIYVALPVVIIIGAVLGAFNGWLIGKFELPSMAVTIGMMGAYRAVALYIGGEKGFGAGVFTPAYTWLGTRYLFGRIPVSLVLLVVLFVVFIFIMDKTVFGCLVYALGNNEDATKYSGHDTFIIKIKLFAIAGAIAGFAAFQYVGQYQSAKADNASTTLLFVVACVVLGGFDINGGKGKVIGISLSLLLLGTVQNILGLLNMQGQVQTLIIGLIMIGSISLPVLIGRIKECSDRIKIKKESKERDLKTNTAEEIIPEPSDSREYLLKLEHVTKSYGGIHALKDISFGVRPGEIHAICGENGAGKSTLIKAITGLIQPDDGKMILNGKQVVFKTPMEARENGIVAMYQDPQLFPNLSIVENVFMGVQPVTRIGSINRAKTNRMTRDICDSLGVKNDINSLVAGLTIAEMEFIQFARSFVGEEKQLYILDEPTASLTPNETHVLLEFLKELRAKGKSVIIITHRLEELEGLADTITVLRDGQHVITKPKTEIETAEIIRHMVGRKFDYSRRPAKKKPGEEIKEVLKVTNLNELGVFEDISFSVKSGEIVGITGLVGSGRSEIAETIFGITKETSGQVFVNGEEAKNRTPKMMMRKGMAFLPEDRDNKGCVVEMSVLENVNMSILDKLAKYGIRNKKDELKVGESFQEKLNIKVPGLDSPVKSLSGGNRQKIVISKWLATRPRVIILDEPTHGIDIAIKDQVHQIIREMAEDGIGIVVISSDLPEIISISDRILVVAEGELAASFESEEATQENIMEAAIFKKGKC